MNVLHSSAPTLPPERPVVLILGANGRFGCAAARAFDSAGWRVLAQVRREPVAELPCGTIPTRMSLCDTAGLAGAAHGATVVVHAVNPVYTRWDTQALPALHAGLDVAEQLGAHFMLPGNVYNFGQTMPPVLREDTPQRPSNRKGEIRVEMERLIARRAAAGHLTASVLRAGDFFGAGAGSWFDQAIVKSLRAGRLVYPGPLDRSHAWAYLPDLARAFVRVAQQPQHPPFACWHFEGHTLDGAALLAAVEREATALGIVPPRGFRRRGMPWRLISALGTVVPMWRELARMSYLWRVPHALDGQSLAALPGSAPAATPLHAAVRESLVALGFGAPRQTQAAH
jgi:nucleoside-diphosphate-sugar epimerase